MILSTRSLKRLKERCRRSSMKGSSAHSSLASSTISSIRRSMHGSFNHNLTVSAAEEKKSSLQQSLPSSLNEETRQRQDKVVVAPFKQHELILGPKLGEGEFTDVYEVESFELQPDSAREMTCTMDESKQRDRMKKIEKYRQTNRNRYALKRIKQNYLHAKGSDAYIQAAGDLAIEAEFLKNLDHPNIIKLRGLTHSGVAGFEQGPSGYFLIIDHLYEILDQRIKQWHMPPSRRSSAPPEGEVRSCSGLLDECLNVALQISGAITYLHSHSITFRDLKPANVGFDVRGDVKIFDFGLARIMPDSGSHYEDTFKMSGACTPRYAAPECLIGKHYNMKADVYTFAIVCWEILCGETPYSFVKDKDHLICHIVNENGRPKIDKRWPTDIQHMLKSSFDSNKENRPTMTNIHNTIRRVLSTLRGGDTKELTHSFINLRRSATSITMNSSLSTTLLDIDADDLLANSVHNEYKEQ